MKIRRWIRQVFRGWVPVEPLTSKKWLKNKLRLLGLSIIATSVITLGILSLVSSPLTAIPPPTFTGEYDPGVSIGDYVTYGNFVCNKGHSSGRFCINYLAFKKMEVIGVSGKEVTFLYTEQLKNGSSTWRSGLNSTWDVEKFDWGIDELFKTGIDFEQIIAANLTEGNCILKTSESAHSEWSRYHSLETEARTYLGCDRNVVVHSWLHREGVYPAETRRRTDVVYDQLSGIRLEIEILAWDGVGYGDLLQGFSVVETNIFSAPNGSLSWFQNTMAEIPIAVLYAATGSITVAIFVGIGMVLRRKRSRGGENDNEQQVYS